MPSGLSSNEVVDIQVFPASSLSRWSQAPGPCPKAEMPRECPSSGPQPDVASLSSHPGMCHGPFARVPLPAFLAFSLAICPPFHEPTAALSNNLPVLPTCPQVPRLAYAPSQAVSLILSAMSCQVLGFGFLRVSLLE